MSLPLSLRSRLRLPLIAAPMFRVSGPELVIAACRAGVIGAFPTANCRSVEELDDWLGRMHAALGPQDAPFCPNLIVRHAGLQEQLACVVQHRAEVVITSVGSPEPVIEPLHKIGCLVLADVASLRHARKAVEAGADGLVLLNAGAGGQTGWVNGLAFVRAVRRFFDGPLVLAGGMSDGTALWAARVLGADLGMMGTRFIATSESMAQPPYKQMLVDSRLDDVMLTQAITGLDTNMLRPSIVAAGLDPKEMAGNVTPERALELRSSHAKERAGPRRWVDIWSAGHSVSGVDAVRPAAELIDELAAQYAAAQRETATMLREVGL